MSAIPTNTGYITLEEYYRLEAASEQRHEYVNGRMIPVGCDPYAYDPAVDMAGGSPEHSQIVVNIIGETSNQLRGRSCRVYDPNLRIGAADGTRHYPDATIVCGALAFAPSDKSRETITNPAVVIEVLSPSTMGYDLGDKFGHYRSIETLQEYVLVHQNRPDVAVYVRQADDTWTFRVYSGTAASVPLQAAGISVALSEIYDGVKFPESPTPGDVPSNRAAE